MANKSIDGGLYKAKPQPIVLGLDASYSGFGFTALTKDGKAFQTWVYKAKGDGVRRLTDVHNWLQGLCFDLEADGYLINDIAMEGYAYSSTQGQSAGELGATVKLFCFAFFDNQAKEPLLVAPTSLKKYITGKGNTQKNQILMHVFKKWGLEFPDDNAADSYGLARIAAGIAEKTYEQQVLDVVTKEQSEFRAGFNATE
jgi:Holliday junction resolvasome RuvABC endonuclease subunit